VFGLVNAGFFVRGVVRSPKISFMVNAMINAMKNE